MAAAKPAVPDNTDPVEVLRREGEAMREAFATERQAVLKAAARFTARSTEHLRSKPAAVQAAFIKGMVEEARIVFQPWAMEIFYVLALLGRARFTDLQRLLGVSSRTLSDKLQALREAGLLDREVFDEQPVRIEYFLTKRGERVAVLGSPLFCELDSRE